MKKKTSTHIFNEIKVRGRFAKMLCVKMHVTRDDVEV